MSQTAYPLTWPAHRARTPDRERKLAPFYKGADYTGRSTYLTVSQACARLYVELKRLKVWGRDGSDVIAEAEQNYRDAMRTAHPDVGGSEARAAQLNAAIALARKAFAS